MMFRSDVWLGIDPGRTTGIALLRADDSVETRSVRANDFLAARNVLESLGVTPTAVAVEGQYVGRNVASAFKVRDSANVWLHAAQALGWTTLPLINPNTWRAVRGGPRAALAKPREQAKAATRAWASRVYGVAAGDDECDALGLAHYAREADR